MPRITFVPAEGHSRTVETASGTTLKDAAVDNGINGIIAECGGNAMCATCHVYVGQEWLDRIPGPDEVEDELLGDTASPRESNSRLSCQISVIDDLDGMTVHVPRDQE
ncbi:2Fe-2S iron-sulfur cluster-binding protein [Rhodococcus sp. IEGM 1381]|uniref:2Fe-2S iron-sulfur cluster-binding protein n=1 Tax=Rhodococcus sp. IEGM 1381 TaxID=3047085 RepID=UPI0024B6B07E|nr:2Fe-2S iron-sulfur cluster-binding protein [Rhodococcus sp. IEGM 1381]MDI9897407.1 2Fe-2S iron-sulfur cluster-binding protein [Rhodococcus sp. IEGM 1381]